MLQKGSNNSSSLSFFFNNRGYERRHLNRPSKKYQSPNNVPFKIPPVEPKVNNKTFDGLSDDALWLAKSIENAY